MNSSVTKQPLISVIVPVYNIIPYLPRCVESLRTQTYENLEILLIDDSILWYSSSKGCIHPVVK